MELAVRDAQELLGSSTASERLRAQVARVGSRDGTVLIEGPAGAGKSFVARLVHGASSRAANACASIRCGGWSLAALERELFGSAGEAPGLLAQLAGGSLVLEEVGELPLELQGVLVRALEQRAALAGGSVAPARDVRFLATTRLDLRQLTAAGRFREDLYYRLNVLCLRVPSLAERADDIEPLARAFARTAAGGGAVAFTQAALARLRAAPWPGNVRELEALIERAVLAALPGPMDIQRPVDLQHLGLEPAPAQEPAISAALPGGERTLRAMEAAWIRQVLDECGGNRSHCARILGIHRATLHAKLRAYGLAAVPAASAR